MPGCGIGSCILYEDQRFLVIDKPANLLVHPTGPGRPDTLWDELKRCLAFEIVNGATISFINRLDRETSGLVLVAGWEEPCACVQHVHHQRVIATESLSKWWDTKNN